mgnify:CR=1 FL=1
MEETKEIAQNQPEQSEEKKGNSIYQSVLLISVITALVSMPAFIIVYKYIPVISIPIGSGFRIDHILTFGLIYAFFYVLIKKFRIIVYGGLILGLVALTITNFMDVYTLKNVYHDYKSMLFSLSERSVNSTFKQNEIEYTKEQEIRQAINYQDDSVIEFARNKAVANFEEDASLAPDSRIPQFFSIFKEIKNRWIYVYDPKNSEYFAKASQTIQYLNADDKFKGDCDDYSILMAASIKAVGGEVRLVKTTVPDGDRNVGHLYPEVKVGSRKDLETIIYLIKNIYFPKESKGKKIHYYIDEKGDVWLNFDYNDDFPGNEYQSDIRDSEIFI